MVEILDRYWLTFLLLGIGLFLVISSYKANKVGRSGIPFLGGILIAAAFLVSPVKWLAVLGLCDHSITYFVYIFISEWLVERRFKTEYRIQGYTAGVHDQSRCLVVSIPEINERLVRPYITNSVYSYFVPKCYFAVCVDRNGRKYLLLDRCNKTKNIEIIPFEKNTVVVEGLKHNTRPTTINIEITASENP